MKTCVIFCAAEFDRLAKPVENCLLIAADGGLRHTQALGLTPDIVLGDFDSLGAVPAGAEVYPVEKDDTDAMLAVRRGLEAGCRKFVLYGAMDGVRTDHTVANFQLLAFLADRDARGVMVGKHQCATVIRNGAVRFPAEFSGGFSVFCLGADAHGVTIRGGKYEVEGVCLTSGFPLGVSNQFMGRETEVSVSQGRLLLLWDRENGLI